MLFCDGIVCGARRDAYESALTEAGEHAIEMARDEFKDNDGAELPVDHWATRVREHALLSGCWHHLDGSES